MINPGGSPSVKFSKSAATRMNNNQTNAQRATMPLNQAAQNSFRNQYSGGNASGPPVGPTSATSTLQGLEPSQQQIQLPTGGPQLPEPMREGFDPAVFMENKLNEIVGNVRTQHFVESPEVKDAMTNIRIKNFMNSSNPNYSPDSRPLFELVIARIRGKNG